MALLVERATRPCGLEPSAFSVAALMNRTSSISTVIPAALPTTSPNDRRGRSKCTRTAPPPRTPISLHPSTGVTSPRLERPPPPRPAVFGPALSRATRWVPTASEPGPPTTVSREAPAQKGTVKAEAQARARTLRRRLTSLVAGLATASALLLATSGVANANGYLPDCIHGALGTTYITTFLPLVARSPSQRPRRIVDLDWRQSPVRLD
jgi:hypothetical protein